MNSELGRNTTLETPTISLAVTWCAALLVIAICFSPQFFTGYSWIDPSETVYHVRELAAGRVPYRDIFTHHFSGYFYPLWIVHELIPLTTEMFWALAILYHWISTVLLSLTALLLCGNKAARFTAIVAATVGVYANWSGDLFVNQSYYQPFATLMILIAVYSLTHWNRHVALLSGVAASVLFMQDQRYALLAGILILPILKSWRERKSPHFLSVLAGFLTPLLLAGAYLYATGALSEFFSQTIMFPLTRRNSATGEGFLGSALSLFGYARSLEPIGTALFLFSGAIVLVSALSSWHKAVLMYTTFSLMLAAILGGRVFPHYALFVGPIATLLIGIAPTLTSRRNVSRGLQVATLTAAILAALTPLLRWHRFGSPFVTLHDETLLATSHILSSRLEPNDSVLVWGYAPQIYLKLDRLSPFRDVSLYSVVGTFEPSPSNPEEGVVPEMKREFSDFFRAQSPRFFIVYQVRGDAVLRSGAFQGAARMPTTPQPQFDLDRHPHLDYVKTHLVKNYRLLERIDHERDWAEIYERVIPTSEHP